MSDRRRFDVDMETHSLKEGNIDRGAARAVQPHPPGLFATLPELATAERPLDARTVRHDGRTSVKTACPTSIRPWRLPNSSLSSALSAHPLSKFRRTGTIISSVGAPSTPVITPFTMLASKHTIIELA